MAEAGDSYKPWVIRKSTKPRSGFVSGASRWFLSKHVSKQKSEYLKMDLQIHSFMQNADDFDATGILLAVKNDKLAGRKFSLPRTDLVTPLALIRIFRQSMETSVQQGKVVTTLLSSPALLRITSNLAKILNRLLC